MEKERKTYLISMHQLEGDSDEEILKVRFVAPKLNIIKVAGLIEKLQYDAELIEKLQTEK